MYQKIRKVPLNVNVTVNVCLCLIQTMLYWHMW